MHFPHNSNLKPAYKDDLYAQINCVVLELNFCCEHCTCLDYECERMSCCILLSSRFNTYTSKTQKNRRVEVCTHPADELLNWMRYLEHVLPTKRMYNNSPCRRGMFCIFCSVTFFSRRERKTRVFLLGHCAAHVNRLSLCRTHAYMRINTRIFASGERRTPLIKAHQVSAAVFV